MKTKKILYWVTVSILIAVFLTSVGIIAHKFITDAQNQQEFDDLAGNKNALASNRPSIPASTAPTQPTAPTVPPEPTQPTVPSEPTILPEYAESYEINNDLVAWIQIPGTRIDYPVVQTPDSPNFYLRKNFRKKYASSGTIYVRETCDVNRPSDNVVVYGHNMQSGVMFHDLINYKKQSFWEENKYIHFDTLTEYHTYEIFAVFVTTADPSKGFRYHLFDDATSAAAYDSFVANCKTLAYYDTGITPQYGEKLLTLSTCDRTVGYGKNGRLVVVARRVL